jgi:hypothetical protein
VEGGFLEYNFFDPNFDFEGIKFIARTYHLINKNKNRGEFFVYLLFIKFHHGCKFIQGAIESPESTSVW